MHVMHIDPEQLEMLLDVVEKQLMKSLKNQMMLKLILVKTVQWLSPGG